ncbi:hypothetical protein [Paraburkholderia phosphatilytica]|uniref:hypothetical protein n=1 Tax=Paraburkholderia phosphatilytica TaxID=2282883 RepID=UPI000E50D538|nr:hypothetical protein [Paraburkholderia phosphatilytica]
MSRSKPAHHTPPPSGDTPHTPDELLDEALEETFPASDPIAVDPPDAPKRPPGKPAAISAPHHGKHR